MVSAWAENGDARKYLKRHKDADRLQLVSVVHLIKAKYLPPICPTHRRSIPIGVSLHS